MLANLSFEASLLRAESIIECVRAAFFLGLGIGLVLLMLRRVRPHWALLGVLCGNAAVWAMSNLPLDRLYAVGASSDRLNHLGYCRVVAAGNPLLETSQVGHMHFEPCWPALMALLSGFDPERLPGIYGFMPLIVVSAFALTLYAGLRPPCRDSEKGADAPWSGWERLAIAGFATLLSSTPMDHLGTYRNPWSMTFLLKPNHALGLVLLPLFVWLLTRANNWRRLVVAGLLLQLIGWVFVLHMAYISAGLVALPALAALRRDWIGMQRGVRELAVVLGVTVVIVSPYLVMLLIGYPFLLPSAHATILQSSAHLLETTLQLGWVFWLGLWGCVVVWRRQGRLARTYEAMIVGAYAFWIGGIPLSLIRRARELDEIYYWIRFLIAASAGIGAWDLMRRIFTWRGVILRPQLRAALLTLAVIPSLLPFWWNPFEMDSYFKGTLVPLPETVIQSTLFLRRNTDPGAVVAGDPGFSQWVAALGARRVLFGDNMGWPPRLRDRIRMQMQLLRGERSEKLRAELASFNVRYLLVTRQWLARLQLVSLPDLIARSDLRLVHLSGDPDGDFIAVFRIAEGAR